MTKEVKCKHYDEENGWCKKLSDWSDPMPHIVYCPKSPCEYAEPIEQPMNDNDIIKALECCGNQMYSCADKRCKAKTLGEAHDLINRQKAEIERLQHIRAELSKENGEQDRAIINALHRMKVVRAEAIKVFAERLRKHLKKRTEYDEGGWDVDLFTVTEEDIDNLVKEMTEDDNGNV